MLTLPVAPGAGAVGRVRAIGPDSTRLAVGDWVTCDPTVRSRDDALTPDITLQGWSARGEGGLHLQKHFHHGSFAEQMLVPTENVFPLGPIEPEEAGRWCLLNLLLVPYSGLLAANFKAGETLLVSGATGNFGSAGVAVALAIRRGLRRLSGPKPGDARRPEAPLWLAGADADSHRRRDGRSRADEARRSRPNRLRPGPSAALRR